MEDKNPITRVEQCRKLLTKIAAVHKDSERLRSVTGRDFSIFSPDLLPLKETTASRVLAHLLDPAGAHGQGTLFLHDILQLLKIPELAQIDVSDVSLSLERPTCGEARTRRLDIVLEGATFVLGIENKLGAGEGKAQLTDYLAWLSTISHQYYLVYLTPHGHDASEWSLSQEARDKHKGHYFLLAWDKLLDALQGCVPNIPPRIGHFVEDFCRAVRVQKLGERPMPTHMEILDYLADHATPDEVRTARVIFHSYREMVEETIFDWLSRLKIALERELRVAIKIAGKFLCRDGGVEYLNMDWREWKFSIKVMKLSRPPESVPPNTVFWCEMLYAWEYDRDYAAMLADPWLGYVMNHFGKRTLSGNMLNVHALGSPTDPDFLTKIRDREHLYLFDALLDAARRVEGLRAAWEKSAAG